MSDATKNLRFTTWLNGNQFKAYPLTQASVTQVGFPQAVIVDCYIMSSTLPVSQGQAFYLSRVQSTGAYVDFYIGYTDGVQTLSDIACIKHVPTTITSGSTQTEKLYVLSNLHTDVEGYEWLNSISGQLAFGDTTLLQQAVTYTFTASTGAFNAICIQTGIACVSKLVIGDQELNGPVTLSAGPGVTLSVDQTNAALPKIVIGCTEISTQTPVSAQAAAQRILEQLGNPITNINSILPDSGGNLYLQGADCVTVTSGVNSVILNNPCSKPCCDNATTQDITAALATVQAAKDVLMQYYSELSNSINLMASRLATLIQD